MAGSLSCDYKLSKDTWPEVTITENGIVVDRGRYGVEVIPRPRALDLRLPDGTEVCITDLVKHYLGESDA